MAFLGKFFKKLDDNGRVVLPKRFRDELSEGVVVTRGKKKCLVVWPEKDFLEAAQAAQQARKEEQGLMALFDTTDESRDLFANAEPGVPDKSGRIILTDEMRDYAGLSKDIVLAGGLDRIEIWGLDAWNDFQAARRWEKS